MENRGLWKRQFSLSAILQGSLKPFGLQKPWRKLCNKHSSIWVQRLHARIANVHRDFLHRATSLISKSHALAFVEDLQVRNLPRSAQGTKENPWQCTGGVWFEQGDSGSGLVWRPTVSVSPQNRYCPECRHIAKENRQAQASFVCMQCGFAENADFVGALNVSRAGVARLACAVSDVVCHVARRPGTHRSDSGALSFS